MNKKGAIIACLMVFVLMAALVAWVEVSKYQAEQNMFAASDPTQQLQMIYQKQLELEQRINMLQGLVMAK